VAERAAAQARQLLLWKEAVNGARRLELADKEYRDGNIPVASRMYVALALRYRATPAGQIARQRLANLALEAREKLRKIDEGLAEHEFAPPAIGSFDDPARGDGSHFSGWPDDSFPPADPAQLPFGAESPQQNSRPSVEEAFLQYDKLARQYEGVPAIALELRRHVTRLRQQPEYAAVLDEPEARELWNSGQEHERTGEACCAFWAYESAARLEPAPSAVLASVRLAEMKRDPGTVAAAQTCRQIRECHHMYLRAERLIESRPTKAREMFAEILVNAPADSEVRRLATQRVAELSPVSP
jgi:hypothetical protein